MNLVDPVYILGCCNYSPEGLPSQLRIKVWYWSNAQPYQAEHNGPRKPPESFPEARSIGHNLEPTADTHPAASGMAF